jgi:hypothetical protein
MNSKKEDLLFILKNMNLNQNIPIDNVLELCGWNNSNIRSFNRYFSLLKKQIKDSNFYKTRKTIRKVKKLN